MFLIFNLDRSTLHFFYEQTSREATSDCLQKRSAQDKKNDAGLIWFYLRNNVLYFQVLL